MRLFAGICFVVIFALLVSCSSGSFGNDSLVRNTSETAFGTSWNAHCSTYNFISKTTINQGTTLGEMYLGSNFSFDISQMNRVISADLGYPAGLTGAGPEALYIWYDDDELLPPPSN